MVETADDGTAGRASQDESIEKLRVANEALRRQLKGFSKALDAAMQANVDDAETGQGGMSARERESFLLERRRLQNALAGKEKQLRGVQKKLEIYKKGNADLKKQVGSTYNAERLAALHSERDEKEVTIAQLQEENRTLVQIQRSQAKKIKEQEAMKSEWPAKVSSLMADMRVAKERVRKAKEREAKAQDLTKKQHEQMMRLAEKNKKLQAQLLEYERSQGHSLADKEKRKLVASWKEEKAKLEHSISVLERSKMQERTKGERLLRANVTELQKVKKEMEKHRAALAEKEKEIRLQLLQVRKLKRQLRDLALGEVPLSKGWQGQASLSPAVAARKATEDDAEADSEDGGMDSDADASDRGDDE